MEDSTSILEAISQVTYPSPPNTTPSYTASPNTAAHFQVPNKGFLGFQIPWLSSVPRLAVLGGSYLECHWYWGVRTWNAISMSGDHTPSASSADLLLHLLDIGSYFIWGERMSNYELCIERISVKVHFVIRIELERTSTYTLWYVYLERISVSSDWKRSQ